MTHAERATAYAERVVSGEIPVGRYAMLSCKRHLDDLKASEDEGYPYRYDHAAANKVCRFTELLPHTKGAWAKKGERIRLEDWQCFTICVPFGWLRKADGLRRFRQAYEEVPRKNAKSTKMAALGNYMFAADGEHGAEVYSGATNEKQAWEVFRPARLMAEKTPQLLDAYGIDVNAKTLSISGTDSRFEPVIGKPGDGASPSFSITDEYHEHQTSDQYDTMVTGMGAREQPLAWVITTAGASIEGPCYSLRSKLVDVLEGKVKNDELYGIIYTVDADDDWTTEAALLKANPNADVSVNLEFLLARQRDAINNPREQSTFKTKHLNIWVTASDPFFNLELWKRQGDPALDEAQFEGEPCWVGLDLASKLDLSSKLKLFKREQEGVMHYYAFCTSYMPEERAQDAALRHYGEWVQAGYLTVAGESMTDYDYIEEDLLADAERFRLVQVGFDPYNATQLVQHLIAHGIECVEVPQTVVHLSEPMKQVQALIQAGRIHHNGDPVLMWGISNVTAKEDRNGNVFPRKERPENKIDPAVALIIAMGRAISSEEVREPTITMIGR